MAGSEPTVTVDALITKATQGILNIQAHRDAMAQVAQQVKVTPPQQPVKEVTKLCLISGSRWL